MTVPMIHPSDTARARRGDSAAAHRAADRSQASLSAVKAAVLRLLKRYGRLSGNDLNEEYGSWQPLMGWPVVSPDSPRKRAGELARDGVIRVLNPDDPRGTPAIYALKDTNQTDRS